ncbi:MAG: hypothetical protein IT432_07380, partial [Phycisphaerales bacterium]|nr:hypothetical protein [Phycisphaerales bacterium]
MLRIAMYRFLAALMMAWLFTWGAANAEGQEPPQDRPSIEQLMRYAQDRRTLVSSTLFGWPGCDCSSSGGPAYPPTGYYGETISDECYEDLAASVQTAVIWLINNGNFLKESTLEQGEATYVDDAYEVSDFSGLSTTITDKATASTVLTACWAAIQKLIYKGTTPDMIDEWYMGGGTASGAGGSSPKDNCADAWTAALDTLDILGFVEEWTQPASTGVFASVDLGTSSEPPDYYVDGLRWEAGRAKFEVEFQPNWVGKARIYVRSEERGDGPCDGSPVAPNGTYLFWSTVSNDEPISEFAGNDPPPFPEQSCTDNYTTGWVVTGYWAICTLPLRDQNGEGVCNLGEVGNDANEETENPPADPLPNTCGGGGPGGPPGGPPGGGNNPTRPGASGPSTGSAVGSAIGDNENKYAGFLEQEAALNAALNGGSDPSSDWPVNLTRGMKLEAATDLVVPTRHGSFAVRRAYSSDGDMGGSNLLGNHWMFSLGAFLRTPVSGSVITLDGWPSDRVVNYTETGSGSGIWKPSGTSNQQITSSSLTIDGTAINVWTLEEPGAWKLHFYRDPSTEEYDGLLLAEEDAYGNLHTYQYALFGSSTQHARLVRIFLDGTPGNGSGASLVFNWYTGSPDATKGKLKSIQHYGLDSSGVSRLMNHVDYAYCTATSANQEGVAGDLVQVTRHTRLDKAPESTDSLFHPSVTLYRYHNGSEPSSNSDERLMAKGSLHQLKSVFNPEQIEFAAEELVTSGGQTWSADVSVLEAAAYIRGLADSASLYTSSPRKVLDYASKIVSYADLSNGKVSHEYLQTSCGCAGSAHGTKLAFSYLSRGTDQPTTKVTESTESSGSYSAYRHTYYDMTNISGVPYLDTVAIVDAADTSKRWVTHIERNTSTYDVTRVVLPSAISTYRPVDDGSGYALTVSTSAGIVVGFDYNGEHRITETRIRNGDSATFSTFTLLKKFTYLT